MADPAWIQLRRGFAWLSGGGERWLRWIWLGGDSASADSAGIRAERTQSTWIVASADLAPLWEFGSGGDSDSVDSAGILLRWFRRGSAWNPGGEDSRAL